MVDVKGLKAVSDAEFAAEPLLVVQGDLGLLVFEDEARSLRAQEKASLEVPQGEILAGANQKRKFVAGRAGADDFPQARHESCLGPLSEKVVDLAVLFGVVLGVEGGLHSSGRIVLFAKLTLRLFLADSEEAASLAHE